MANDTTSIWGVGAVVLGQNRVSRFPHERPKVPKNVLRSTYRQLHAKTDVEFLQIIINRFLQLVRQMDTAGGILKPDSPDVHEVSFWLMLVTQVSKQRYWIITSVEESTCAFQPIVATSTLDAMQQIDRAIEGSDGAIIH